MEFVHVATRTKDLDRAIAFYEALGLHLDHRSELTKNKATLAFMAKPGGDFAIELVYNWGKDDGYDGGERFGHFAFDVDDIEAEYARLLAAGGDGSRPAAGAAAGRGPPHRLRRRPRRQLDRADRALRQRTARAAVALTRRRPPRLAARHRPAPPPAKRPTRSVSTLLHRACRPRRTRCARTPASVSLVWTRSVPCRCQVPSGAWAKTV